jgi:hypothetical protein
MAKTVSTVTAVAMHSPASQRCAAAQLPHEPPQLSSPHALPVQLGTHASTQLPALHDRPSPQLPHDPPHPSAPHSRPWQSGVHPH